MPSALLSRSQARCNEGYCLVCWRCATLARVILIPLCPLYEKRSFARKPIQSSLEVVLAYVKSEHSHCFDLQSS